uniref:SET domain-containing protein n=2 Tax=Phlebotominae TaxID=7198 RepID=A0A1B0DIQ2_PHLPP
MSRSSIPNGLHIIETGESLCVVTSQKFAKGTRFGPLMAKKSYIPVENAKFPLIVFGSPLLDSNDAEIEELFKIRNAYLDTRNENYCNWMIHVSPAQYSNEQNLICYQ